MSNPTVTPTPTGFESGSPTATRPAEVAGDWIVQFLLDPWSVLQPAAEAQRDTAPWAVALVAGLGLLAALRWWWQRAYRSRGQREARVITVLAPPVVEPTGGAAVWANLAGLQHPRWKRWLCGQPHLAWEYQFSPAGVQIRLWVPATLRVAAVQQAVLAAWPGAHLDTSPADPPLPLPRPGRTRVVVAGTLRLARPETLPLRSKFDADPLRALLGASAGLDPGEHACVQILARPVTGHRLARVRAAARGRHPGGPPHPWLSVVLDLLTPGSTAAASTRERADQQTARDHSAARGAITGKTGHGGHYEALIRYAACAELPPDPTHAERRHARNEARGRAHTLAAAFAAYTDYNYYTRCRLPRPAETLAARELRRGDLLSIDELAALAHLPTDLAIPGLARAGARAIAPPPSVPALGPGTTPLGVSDASDRPRAIALRVPDARHHLHVLGSTGTGKSTLLAQLILADAHAGRGVIVLDPKGDLVTDVLARLPRPAADRAVVVDPDSDRATPCLNPLHSPDTYHAVDNLVSIFSRVYAGYWGPRTDDLMRAACLTVRAQPHVSTLADVERLLSEPALRHRYTAAVTDPVLSRFWTWFDDLTDAARAQVIAPLMNKLRAFLLRPFVRDTIAAGPATVDLEDILNGGICLVRIPKGSLGDDTTRLIGSLVLAGVWQATTARAATPQHQRPDAHLVIDECHNFLHLPYPLEDMLAEFRGLRVATTLAHQNLGQLRRELRDAISTNARNKIFFTSSPEDARDLARHTTPRLGEHDLAHLGAFHAAARLVVHGQHTDAFTLRTRPLPPAPSSPAHPRTQPGFQRTAATAPARPLRAPATPTTDPRHQPRSTDPRRA